LGAARDEDGAEGAAGGRGVGRELGDEGFADAAGSWWGLVRGRGTRGGGGLTDDCYVDFGHCAVLWWGIEVVVFVGGVLGKQWWASRKTDRRAGFVQNATGARHSGWQKKNNYGNHIRTRITGGISTHSS
jgi:hypothetical protein